MQLPLSIHLAACALLFASSAGAAGIDPKICADAAFQGQTFRDDDNLLEARERLRVCVRQERPTFVQKDCAGWLEDVEKRLPSVVLSATDPSGRDLVDVKVTAEGRLLTERRDGKSLPMNPGHHSFVFERDGGGSATIDVVLAEGEKERRVSIVVSAPDTSVTAALPPVASEPRSRGWTLAGYTVAGAGVVGQHRGRSRRSRHLREERRTLRPERRLQQHWGSRGPPSIVRHRDGESRLRWRVGCRWRSCRVVRATRQPRSGSHGADGANRRHECRWASARGSLVMTLLRAGMRVSGGAALCSHYARPRFIARPIDRHFTQIAPCASSSPDAGGAAT
jgi:hypothetical protein